MWLFRTIQHILYVEPYSTYYVAYFKNAHPTLLIPMGGSIRLKCIIDLLSITAKTCMFLWSRDLRENPAKITL